MSDLTTAVNTFGVNATTLRPFLAQYNLGGSGANLLTDARITEVVTQAAAPVCAAYITSGADLTTVAADSTSIAYQQARHLITIRTVILLAFSLGGLGVGQEDALQDLRDEYRAAMAALRAQPEQLGGGAEPSALSNVPTVDDVATGAYAPRQKWASPTRGW